MRAVHLFYYFFCINVVSAEDERDLQIQPRIVGGYNAEKGRYPNVVSLVSSATKKHKCGGILVAKDVVLTAAHCSGNLMLAEVGRYNRWDSKDDYDELRILEEYPHPLFDEDNLTYDFMLLKLDGSSKKNPVKLNKKELDPHDDPVLTAVGFGLTDPDRSSSASIILQEVQLDYIPNEICETSSNGEDSYDGYLNNNMLCATAEEKDTCNGDSGGPLLLRHEENSEDTDFDLLVGITSWGFACADPDFPGVYARVSNQIDILTDMICEISDSPPSDYNCPTFGSDGTIGLLVRIQLDSYPSESWWKLSCKEENIIYGLVRVGEYGTKYMQQVEQMIFVPDGVDCTFTIRDEYGDGLGQSGHYKVLLDDSILAEGGKNFGYQSSQTFSIPRTRTVAPTSVPSRVPSQAPTRTPTTSVPTKRPTNVPIAIPEEAIISYIRKTRQPTSKVALKLSRASQVKSFRGNVRSLNDASSNKDLPQADEATRN